MGAHYVVPFQEWASLDVVDSGVGWVLEAVFQQTPVPLNDWLPPGRAYIIMTFEKTKILSFPDL
jgi:hypothetical protein